MASTRERPRFRSVAAWALRRLFGPQPAKRARVAKSAEIRSCSADADFRLMIEHCSDVVIHVGSDGVGHYASPSVLQIYGLPPKAFIGQPIEQFIDPEDRTLAMTRRAQLLRGEVEQNVILFRPYPGTGQEIWIESRAQLLRDPTTGRIGGYVAFSRNVTERIRREAEWAAYIERLKSANASLEILVRYSHQVLVQAEVASDLYPGEDGLGVCLAKAC